VLVSRHGGTLTWSPDSSPLAIGEIPEPDPVYNGNPRRDRDDPPASVQRWTAYRLWIVPAPRAVDEGRVRCAAPAIAPTAPYRRAFESVWATLKRMYYQTGESAANGIVCARARTAREQARSRARSRTSSIR
jgi:hypothetical protein